MNTKNCLCGGTKFAYSRGYIGLPIPMIALPETIIIEGETLCRKDTFHVSLMYVNKILNKKPDAEQMILDEFCVFVAENDISFIKYTGEFRFALQKEKKTLVAMCEISNLHKFSKQLSDKLGVEVSAQPTHVTLFTLQPNMGIGLDNLNDLEAMSVVVQPIAEVVNALNLSTVS
jgi:hypothetical protein